MYYMKSNRIIALIVLLAVAAVATASIPAAPASYDKHSVIISGRELPTTARYQGVAQPDVHFNFNLYESGEGFHYLKPSPLDETFAPAQPDRLFYSSASGENRPELAEVEYLILLALSLDPPASFTGIADQWRKYAKEFGL